MATPSIDLSFLSIYLTKCLPTYLPIHLHTHLPRPTLPPPKMWLQQPPILNAWWLRTGLQAKENGSLTFSHKISERFVLTRFPGEILHKILERICDRELPLFSLCVSCPLSTFASNSRVLYFVQVRLFSFWGGNSFGRWGEVQGNDKKGQLYIDCILPPKMVPLHIYAGSPLLPDIRFNIQHFCPELNRKQLNNCNCLCKQNRGEMSSICHELTIQCHIQSCLNRCIVYMPEELQTKWKTCFGGPRMVLYGC